MKQKIVQLGYNYVEGVREALSLACEENKRINGVCKGTTIALILKLGSEAMLKKLKGE